MRQAPDDMLKRSRQRLFWLASFYLACLSAGAAYTTLTGSDSWKISVWVAGAASFPLATFGLGGEELYEERLSKKWWFVTPRYEFLPLLGCFLVGMFLFFLLEGIFSLVARSYWPAA